VLLLRLMLQSSGGSVMPNFSHAAAGGEGFGRVLYRRPLLSGHDEGEVIFKIVDQSPARLYY
jgi:hypothetical protein